MRRLDLDLLITMEKKLEKAAGCLWDRRVDEAKEILESLPKSADALNDLAVARYFAGDKEVALDLLREALELDPTHGPAQLNARYIPIVKPVAPSRHKVLDDWGPPPGPPPSVSVVMPHYNRVDFLEEAVRSILDQSRNDVEVVISNDGGNRDCEPILKRIGTDRIRYLYIEHAGQSVAMNAAIAHARGRYVCYLDDDDIFYPDHVETLAGYLDEHPDCMVAYTHAMRAEQIREGGEWKIIDRKVVNREPYDRKRLLRSNRIPICVAMHRREVTEELGGFNEELMAAKDWEMWIRLSSKYPFHRIDKTTCEFRIRTNSQTQITAKPVRQRHYDNYIIYLHKITPITNRMPNRPDYAKAMKIFGRMAARFPVALDIIDIRYLYGKPRKLYPLFYNMGRGLVVEGHREAAKAAFAAAAGVAPWEPKMYMAWLRTSLGGTVR